MAARKTIEVKGELAQPFTQDSENGANAISD